MDDPLEFLPLVSARERFSPDRNRPERGPGRGRFAGGRLGGRRFRLGRGLGGGLRGGRRRAARIQLEEAHQALQLASQSMGEQARELQGLMGFFKLDSAGPATPAPKAAAKAAPKPKAPAAAKPAAGKPAPARPALRPVPVRREAPASPAASDEWRKF